MHGKDKMTHSWVLGSVRVAMSFLVMVSSNWPVTALVLGVVRARKVHLCFMPCISALCCLRFAGSEGRESSELCIQLCHLLLDKCGAIVFRADCSTQMPTTSCHNPDAGVFRNGCCLVKQMRLHQQGALGPVWKVSISGTMLANHTPPSPN